MEERVDVIATTISGSIKDWGKVGRIVPLFKKHGYENVSLVAVDSHRSARERTCECLHDGGRTIISAGGSGTFNAVLEGCCDSGVPLGEIRLGFLRKGSADLIGKVLNMPDGIEQAVAVLAASIGRKRCVPCDILVAETEGDGVPPRHFAGYGGAEIFGEIPHYTENRFTKYYKGILGQLFGDLGPFFVGTCLAATAKVLRLPFQGRRTWSVAVDGVEVSRGCYQALIIVNGDLGPNMPFARGVPLGSGDFYLFTIEDRGLRWLLPQIRRAWNSSFQEGPEKWGFASFRVQNVLRISPDDDLPFSVNTDGTAMPCVRMTTFHISGRVNLIST